MEDEFVVTPSQLPLDNTEHSPPNEASAASTFDNVGVSGDINATHVDATHINAPPASLEEPPPVVPEEDLQQLVGDDSIVNRVSINSTNNNDINNNNASLGQETPSTAVDTTPATQIDTQRVPNLKRPREDAETTNDSQTTKLPAPAATATTLNRGPKKAKELKPPKPPKTAFELFATNYKRLANAASKRRKNNASSNNNNNNTNTTAATKPTNTTMATVREAYDKLSLKDLQQWKIQQAEDLLRYETQMSTYVQMSEMKQNQNESTPEQQHAKKMFHYQASKALEIATTNARQRGYGNHSTNNAKRTSPPSTPRNASTAPGRLTMARSSFNDFIVELIKFKCDKGHCRVPIKKGGVLGKWVDRIRKEYKKLKPTKRELVNTKQIIATEDGNKIPREAVIAAANRAVGLVQPLPNMGAAASVDANALQAGINSFEPPHQLPFDIVVEDHGIYFENAYGRNLRDEHLDPIDAASAAQETVVPDNVRLDCYTASDLAIDSKLEYHHVHPKQCVNQRFDRIRVLHHLGFIWEFPNEDYEEIWQKHFKELLEYKAKHGNCNVPQKGHGRLSWWVKIQRELYVNTTQPKQQKLPNGTKRASRPRQVMPQHRIQQLESVGFEWRIRPPALKWEERYKELIEYKRRVGDCNVPQNYPPNRVLGKWVMKQRGYYYDKVRGKKSPLNAKRQSQLEAIGFCWVAPHVAKTKARLPLRENIIKEQLRASQVVEIVVAAANGQGNKSSTNTASTTAAAIAVPNSNTNNTVDIAIKQNPPQQQQQHSQLEQLKQDHQQQALPQQHPQSNPNDIYQQYQYRQQQQHQQQQHNILPSGIQYFGAPNDPQQQHQQQHTHTQPPQQHQQHQQHVGGLGSLDGAILNHISPADHYLSRPLDHGAQQHQSPQQQQVQQHQSPQQQQQLPYHHQHHLTNDDGGHHLPPATQQQQQQQHSPSPHMMFHHPQQQQQQQQPNNMVATGATPVYSPFLQAPDDGAVNNHQQQQEQQQQTNAQGAAPADPYFQI